MLRVSVPQKILIRTTFSCLSLIMDNFLKSISSLHPLLKAIIIITSLLLVYIIVEAMGIFDSRMNDGEMLIYMPLALVLYWLFFGKD